MTDPLPAPPSAVDFVPTEAFDELIARTQKDLARLDREHTIAEAAAVAAERNVSDVPDDPELHDWAEAQLDRFVAGLRAEHDAEMDSVLAAARQRAAVCVERAELEADLVLSYARATVDARGGKGAVGAAPVSGPVVWRADAGDAETIVPEPPPNPAPIPAPPTVVTAPAPAVAPPPASAPELVVPGVAASVPPPAPEIVVPAVSAAVAASPFAPGAPRSASPWADLAADQGITPAEPPAVDDPVKQEAPALVSTTGADGGGTPAEPDREFWKEPESQAPKQGLFKRLPMFAILQVVGVVIVLIVVLLRIG